VVRRTLLIGLFLLPLLVTVNAAAQTLPGSLQSLANPLMSKLTSSLGVTVEWGELEFRAAASSADY